MNFPFSHHPYLRRGVSLLLIVFLLLQVVGPVLPGVAQGETPAGVDAIPLNALSLSGSDGYVSIPYSAETNTFSAMTIEAWVYRANTSRNETVLGNGWQDSYWMGFSPTGKLRFIPHGGGYVDSTATVYAEEWTHVAVTYNGLTRNFYINGVLDKTSNAGPGPITGNPGTALGIGFDSDPFAGNYFDGVIDEVRLWNVARSAADIQAAMFTTFSAPLPSSLVGYWKLDGNADDASGEHDGTLHGGLGSSSWVTDGGLPHDIRIPQVGTAPTLDGQCGDYPNAAVVAVDGLYVSLQHTATDLWACFNFYTSSNYTRASLLLDPTHDRLDPAQPDDIRFDVRDDDTLATYAGDDAGHWVITDTYDTQWGGAYHVTGGEFPLYSAEFRLSAALVGGWGHLVGLALDPYDPGPIFTDLAGIWPALAASTLPSTWSSATLAGVGPTRAFSGSVQYQPKNATYPPSGVNGAKVELYAYDVGGSEALVASATSGYSGNFSLTTNDDFSRHRLELVSTPPGYVSTQAEAPSPATVVDPRTIEYGTAGGGTYPNNLFTLGDPVPQSSSAPYGPVFLIVASQAVIDAGALDAFRTFKIQQGYAVSIRSVEEADTYPGATRLERIRALEQDYRADYGDRFQFVMLVGTDSTIPFAKITPYATGEAPVCPNEDPKNYKYSDWLYVDLTSNPNTNGNACALDGPLSDPAKRLAGYVPDEFAFDPTVSLGRIPFDDANTVRLALQNSMGFEKQSESYKLNALHGMSLVALKGYFEGSPCDGDNWGDHCVPPSANDAASYDTGLLAEEMKGDFLNVNGFDSTALYENEAAIAGGQVSSPVDLTRDHVREALDEGRFGLAVMSGHGNSTGVYRNFWASDKNMNGVVDVSDDSSTELSEVSFFDVNNVLDDIGAEGPRGSVFVLLACSNASPTNTSNLAATVLSGGHGPASVAALSVVTVGSWFHENNSNVESIGYYVNKRLVSYGYRLGESLWWTLADLVHKKKSGSGGVSYDLYGDPTLSFYGNPGGQTTLAAWPMGRRDPGGASYLSLPGPTYPKKLWEYTTGMHTADTYGPTPLVSNNGEVIVAAETYVDVLRQGTLYQRLSLDAYVFGSPALSADGTLYVMDQNADLYAFPYRRLAYGGHTYLLNERSRRWKVDLGENPQASPVVGSDGYILAGVGGALAADPRLWLVRPDGVAFSSWALDHNPVYYASTDASRTLYVATSGQDGHLYRFTQFCDTFVYPDVCPHNSWVEATVPDAFYTPPLLAYGSLYIGDVDDTLYKFNKETLAVEATFVADSAIQMGPIASPNGDVLFVTGQGVMYSLTKNLSMVRWQKNLGSTSIFSIPAASNNAIYLAFDGYLRAYNPNSGALLWKRSLGGEIAYASVSVGFGREVYVQGLTGKVLAFGEGWGLRPARLTALPGVMADGRRQFMRLEIQQSLPPISGTLALAPAVLPAEGGEIEAPATPVAMLLQRSQEGGPWEEVALLDPGVSVYTDTNVSEDLSYVYRVQNLMSDGKNSDFETTLDAVQSYPDAPAAPVLSPLDALSAENLGLEWTSPPGVVDTFGVERGLSVSGPFTTVVTLNGETTSWVDSGLAAGTSYYYRVSASNISATSVPSNVQGGTTKTQTLAAPQNVLAGLDGNLVTLTWDAGPLGASAVIEIRAFGETTFSPLAMAPADGSYSLPLGEPNAYEFRLKFVLGGDESGWGYSKSVEIVATQVIYLPVIR